MKNFKILLLNLGYCTKLNGSMFDYFTKFHRYPFLSKKIENETLKELSKIIKNEKPDLICIPEIKLGKQISHLNTKEYPFVSIDVKYGRNSFLRKIKSFANKGNAMVSKNNLSFKKHYLENGTKKLLLEATLPDQTKIFLMHFSLNKNVRKKQFLEIHEKFKNTKKKIICGDFNIFKGIVEVEEFMSLSKLELANKEGTFPAFKPQKALDLFLIPKGLPHSTRLLKNQLSDHLPVILEIKL